MNTGQVLILSVVCVRGSEYRSSLNTVGGVCQG